MPFSMLGLLFVLCSWRPCAAGKDTSTVTAESSWYFPDDDWAAVTDYITNWQGQQSLHVLDLFGKSRAFQRCWERRGFKGAALDILLGGAIEDILSRDGWFNYLDHALQLLDGGLLAAGPPCSLYIYISSGTHARYESNGFLGNIRLLSVRMSNAIVKNFVALLKAITPVRRIYYMVEQPQSSVMFDLPNFASWIANLAAASIVMTWLGFWGHPLVKPTKLLTNFAHGYKLHRAATKAAKAKHAEQQERKLQKQRAKGKPDPCFYRKDKKGRVHGGPDLASTAAYPGRFVAAVFKVWSAEYEVFSASNASKSSNDSVGYVGCVGSSPSTVYTVSSDSDGSDGQR